MLSNEIRMCQNKQQNFSITNAKIIRPTGWQGKANLKFIQLRCECWERKKKQKKRREKGTTTCNFHSHLEP
jgi:hypothetical protein